MHRKSPLTVTGDSRISEWGPQFQMEITYLAYFNYNHRPRYRY